MVRRKWDKENRIVWEVLLLSGILLGSAAQNRAFLLAC